jgi:outer membrane protein
MKKTIVALLIFASLQVAFVYGYLSSEKKKIAYADAIRVFNGYRFKADLEKMSQGTLISMQESLDSAEAAYRAAPQNQEVQQRLLASQQRMAAGYNAINKEINDKVWDRLNPVISKFGKEKGLDLLIGANGMGTVLYADDSKDITDDLIRYINENYEKGN